MMRRLSTVLASLLLLLAACGPQGEPDAAAESGIERDAGVAESADSQFDRTLDDMTRAFFFHSPELATKFGVPETVVPRTAHRLKDRSRFGETGRREELMAALDRMLAIDALALTGDRPRTHAIVTTLMEGALAPARIVDYGTTIDGFGFWYLPYTINQLSGPTVDIPNFLNTQQPVTSSEDAEAYLVRLAAVAGALDGALENVRDAASKGVIPPDFVVGKSLAVVQRFVSGPAEQNSLYTSFVERLRAADVAGADDYAARALTIVGDEVIPAYRRIGDYLGEMRAAAPHDAGLWRLPHGNALYRAMIRHMTDTDRSPEEVHEIGLAEVARITSAMDTILQGEGYREGSVGERMQALAAEDRFVYPNDASGRAAVLADARAQIDGVMAVLPQWFGRLPPYPVEVRPVPAFSQASAPIAYYDKPAPDGSRPGVYWLNLRDTAMHPRFALPTLTYHEAVPGHHLQGATDIGRQSPPLIWAISSNASREGWALYAEQLAAEMGLYEGNPYGDLGRLRAELRRAVRLVVDTGMHAKKWSREQAIDYMVGVVGVDEGTAVSEVERYAVWPAQALGYKLGMLKILELRSEARARLGDAFDIRDFNDTVLDVAATPLPYIEITVREWLERTDM